MRKFSYIFTLLFCFGLSFLAQAQDDYKYPLAVEEEGLLNYMANLAWLNNPANDNFFQEEVIAKENVKIERRGWWKDIGLTVNLNENSFAADSIKNDAGVYVVNPVGVNSFFPKYNFAARFSIGSMLDNKNKRKIAERKVMMAESTTQQAKKDTRAEIIQMYQEYLTSIEILKLRYQSESDMKENFDLVSRLFNRGDERVGMKDINDASLALNNARESRIKSNKMVTISKLKLEEFIGVKLEAVQSKFEKKN